jgi:hypothetical protein
VIAERLTAQLLGRQAGRRSGRGRATGEVVLKPFTRLDARVRAALQVDARDVLGFLRLPA